MDRHKLKRWEIKPQAPDSYLAELGDLHEVLAQVLYNRGHKTPQDARSFLTLYPEDDNPFRLKGMSEAVYRLRMAIRHNEPIAVYGDFDCDGVTSTVLLTEVLNELGADVRPYIPDRVDEGYGLNSPALKNLAEQGVKVVVTVDCGIRSVREVEDAVSYGLDMIVTDHHSVGHELPPASAVINPKQPGCPYPDKMLAGVGLAYKLAQGLFMEQQRRGYRVRSAWRPEDWLDLVAVGTVADIAPLQKENRVLVKEGLRRLNQPQRPGLQALYDVAGVRPGKVNTVTIGFFLGPRINAAGRLETAMLAYDLLKATNRETALKLAQKLNETNRIRQEKTREMQVWAEEALPGEAEDEPLLFAADQRFEQGVVGLVASRLTEQYYRPAVVVQVGEEESHGSCRSIPEFHITEALEQCSDLLERFGGHAAAAGFTVKNEHIEELNERLWHIAAEALGEVDLMPVIVIDKELQLKDITDNLADSLAALEPTGEANSPPVFVTRGLEIVEIRPVGAEASHLKLQVRQEGYTAEAIAFRWGDVKDELPQRVDLVYNLEINEWNGRSTIQLNVQDIKPA